MFVLGRISTLNNNRRNTRYRYGECEEGHPHRLGWLTSFGRPRQILQKGGTDPRKNEETERKVLNEQVHGARAPATSAVSDSINGVSVFPHNL